MTTATSHDEMTQAFDYLQRNGMKPTWVGGNYIVANVPCMVESGGRRWMETTPHKVRTLSQAIRLVDSCS